MKTFTAYYTARLGKDSFDGSMKFNHKKELCIITLQEELKDLYGYDIVQVESIKNHK